MKRGRILNAELSKAIALMGHGDLFMVCDAGFPIPLDRWRIDLAITRDLPDLYTVLDLVLSELTVFQGMTTEPVLSMMALMIARLRSTAISENVKSFSRASAIAVCI